MLGSHFELFPKSITDILLLVTILLTTYPVSVRSLTTIPQGKSPTRMSSIFLLFAPEITDTLSRLF
jgi:hypothetical protein